MRTANTPAAVYLRLGASVLGLALAIVAALVIARLLHETPRPTEAGAGGQIAAPRSEAPTTKTAAAQRPVSVLPTPGSPGFPAPPRGAVVFSQQHGSDAVALAVVPERRSLLLQLSILGSDGRAVEGLRPTLRLTGTAGPDATSAATACGSGRYCAVIRLRGRPVKVSAALGGSGSRSARIAFGMPATWPPPRADALVLRAAAAWRRLDTLVAHERLASDAQHAVQTVWTFVAPDRVGYRIAGGAEAVIIGARRWDRVPGGNWQLSSQQPLQQPVPFWSAVADARVLGTVTVRGRRAWRVSFFDPRTPAWFTAAIEQGSLRTLDLQMVTAAHFMHEVYSGFNTPQRLRPPCPQRCKGGKR